MDASSSFLDGLVDLPPMGPTDVLPALQIKPEPQDIPPISSAVNISIGIKQEMQDDFSQLSSHSCSMSSPDMTAASSVRIKQEPNDITQYCNNNSCDAAVSSSTGIDAQKPAKPKAPKKRKSKSDLAADNGQTDNGPEAKVKIKQEKITTELKVRKKRDRFNGMTEEEVLKRTLPDHLRPGLDIIIVGINPGLTAAYVGHHYAGPGNHFWKCLYLSGLIPEVLTAYDDVRLMDFGIGFTNIVERTSRGSADLTRKEIKDGGEILREKIQKYKPKIAVFNGKGIYEVFCGHKNFYIGKQPEPFPGTDAIVYVMPSSSARCSQLPRAIDKVPFYAALKKLRDHMRGDLPQLDEAEVCFPDLELKVEPKKVKEEALENGVAPDGKKKRQRPKGKKDANKCIEANGNMGPNGPMDMMPNHMGMPGFPQGPFHPGMMMQPIKQEPGQTYGSTNCLGQTPMGMFGSAAHRMPMIPDPNIDSLFANQPVLVKQEDTSDLAKYGLLPPNGLPAPPLSHPPLINSSPSSHGTLVPYSTWQSPLHSTPSSIASFSSVPSTSSFSFTPRPIEPRTSPAQAFQPWQQPSPLQQGQPPQHYPPHPQGSPNTPGHTPPRMPQSFNSSPGSYNGSPGSYSGSPSWSNQGQAQGHSPGHCQGQGQGQGQTPPQGQFSQWPGYPGQQPGQYQGHPSPGQGQGPYQGQLSPGHYPGPQLSPHTGVAPNFSNMTPLQIKQEPGSAFGPCLSQH